MKVYMIIIIFLMIGAMFIISENNLALKNPDNFSKVIRFYFSWIGNVFVGSGKIVGYAVKMNWLPENNSSG